MNFLKVKFWQIWSYLEMHPREVSWSLSGFFLVVSLFQFSTYSSLLASYSAPRSLVMAYDEDSSFGIETALKTQWFNHNGSTTYGPLYYRLSVPFRNFMGESYGSQNLSLGERKEKTVYFHLMLLNLLAVFGSSLLLVRRITSSVHWQILGMNVLSAAFLANEMRSGLVFLAKPDHVLTFFVTLALLTSVNFLADPGPRRKKWMALAWGVASSVKLTTIFYWPFFIFLFWDRRSWKSTFHQTKEFFLWMAGFYFLVGFPQNFDLGGYLGYLLQQNSHTQWVSWKFFSEQWMPLIFQDLWRPLLVIVLFTFVFPLRRAPLRYNSWERLAVFVGGALLFLISKEHRSPFQWYTFIFVQGLLVCGLCLFLWLPELFKEKTGRLWGLPEKWRVHFLTPVFAFFLFPHLVPTTPRSLEKLWEPGQVCRPEMMRMKMALDERMARGVKILSDPLMPFDRQYQNKMISPLWEMSVDFLRDGGYGALALNQNYNSIYFNVVNGQAGGGVTHLKNIEPTRDFYQLFRGFKQIKDPFGQEWQQVLEAGCGFELWEKK